MSYSAVTHPPPCASFHLGTLCSQQAVQRTVVLPKRIKTEPGADSVYPRMISTTRRSDAFLPSDLATFGTFAHVGAGND